MLDLDTVANGTLNVGDSIDGKGGQDTANLLIAAGTATTGSLPSGINLKSVEIINLTYAGTGDLGALNSTAFADVEQLWQVDNDSVATGTFQDITVSEDVTAGFRSTGDANAVAASVTVNAAAATQKSASAAVDGVSGATGTASSITFAGTGLETVNVSGSVATVGGNNELTVAAAATAETANIALESNTEVSLTGAALEAVDLSGSEGDITLDTSATGNALTALTSLKGGSGADELTVDLEQGEEVTVDAGAGNDVVTLNNGTATSNVASTVTLGDGKDTLVVSAISNIADADEASFADGIIEVTDFNIAEDTIDLGGKGEVLTTAQLDNAEGEASLFDAAAYVDGLLTTGGTADSAAVFNWGGDAYVLVDNADAGTTNPQFDDGDGLIKLTGLDATALSTDQDGGLVL